jgi:hypothetical protein
MQHLIHATRAAVKDRNWYAALALALALPDICGRLQTPKSGVGARYRAWWERYAMPRYMGPKVGTDDMVPWLSGADAYALRCAFLHEGSDDITGQRAREALARVRFVEPPRGFRVHMNGGATTLQVQVDIFCEDVCVGAEQWWVDHAANPAVKAQIPGLLRIYDVSGRVLT